MAEQALQGLIAGLRSGGVDFGAPPEVTRASFEALLSTLPVAADLAVTSVALGGVSALRVSTPGSSDKLAVLYLHGGAFVVGSAKGYLGLAAELGRAAQMTTFIIDYRLAPEQPFPAAVDDAVAAFSQLIALGFDPAKIVLAGDSAGGGLVVSTLVALRDQGVPLPAAALLISPWADLACDSPSMKTKAAEDPALTAAGLRIAAAHYLNGADPRSPLASPLYANLSGLPPLLIQVGSAEILLDDAVRLAGVAGAAGVSVQLQIWPEMIHVWHAFAFLLQAGKRAIELAGAFLHGHTEQQVHGNGIG